MKKPLAVALLYTLIIAATIPALGQRRPVRSKLQTVDLDEIQLTPVSNDASIQFGRIEAWTEGQGAFVRWVMEKELSNFGFRLYRVEKRGLVEVDKTFVIGSMGRRGPSAQLPREYSAFDPQGGLGTTYVIRSLSADGTTVDSPAISTSYTYDLKNTVGIGSDDLNSAASAANRTVQNEELSLDGDLLATVQTTTQQPNLAVQRTVAGKPGAKIAVRREGMYRVQRSQLPASAFDNSDTTKWRLFADGNEQAINVGPGGQYIEFYGKPIDTPESDTRTYYLVVDTVSGKRIANKAIPANAAPLTATSYTAVSELRERLFYYDQLFNGDGEDYLGSAVSTAVTSISVPLTAVDTSAATAKMTVKMQGAFSAMAHQANVVLNGHTLGVVTGGSGTVPYSKEFTFPGNYLFDGANTLALNMTATGDFSFFDSAIVTYERRFTASQNRIAFTSAPSRKVTVSGFTSPNFRIFDIAVDGTPALVSNTTPTQNGGTFGASLLASKRGSVYFGVEDSALLTPASVTDNTPSNLATPQNAADAVIISDSTPEMMNAAEAWANYRRSSTGGNFSVKVVDIADVFDEFSYGVATAAGIKEFLRYTYTNWQAKPKYTLLVGDATYDPRNYEGTGYWNRVPSKMVDLIFAESPSDDALADFDEDGLAEMAVGRAAYRTGADVTSALNKTIKFESLTAAGFNRGFLFAYDKDDLGVGLSFQQLSQSLAAQLPAGTQKDFIKNETPESNAPLMAAINSGKYMVNYSGHGSSGQWASVSGPVKKFFELSDVPLLTNTETPSFFTLLTCLNGFFTDPTRVSLGDKLLSATNGGSAATWASTGDTFATVQRDMGLRFYSQLAAGNTPRVGDLIRDAKSVIVDGQDVRYSWVLLGDPMLKMR
jgi:hypothetical protein